MDRLRDRRPFGRTGLLIPPIIFGSSALGNLYREIPYEEKRAIVEQWFETVEPPVVIDSAGKYGAGLALETLGRILRDLGVSDDAVVISNKLAWKRVALRGREPTFEPGVWKGLSHDAVQTISSEGMRECWAQGRELLGAPYSPALASVHDPDEYLAAAADSVSRARRLEEILDAYRALEELKASGEIAAIGLGAKDWRVLREIAGLVRLDWVMLACSLTVHSHPKELLDLVAALERSGTGIINSAVFNSGFLIGGDYYDYRKPDPAKDASLFRWREAFVRLCGEFEVKPADVCVEFALSPPGIAAVSLNTGNPHHVAVNVASVRSKAPAAFWHRMKEERLIDPDYPYLGEGGRQDRDGRSQPPGPHGRNTRSTS